MNNYRLHIQRINGEWKLADLGDNKPAMNFQINNIAELKNRQVDYSQSLSLPLSGNNCDIFEYSNEFESSTEIPYRKLNCRLYSGNYAIAGAGSYLILDRVKKDFQVQILSGNVDLFELLSNSKLADLDLGFYQLGSMNIYSNYSDDNYCIPTAVFIKNGQMVLNTSTEHAYPFAWFKNAIEKILSTNGYTIETNLLDADWNSKAINIVSLNPTPGSYEPFTGEAELITVQSTPTGYLRIPITDAGSGQLTQENPEGNTTQALQYKAIESGSVRVIMNVSRTTSYNPDITTLVISNLTTGETLYNNVGISHFVDITDSVDKDNIIRITLNRFAINPGPLPQSFYTINVNLSLTSESKVPINGNVYISPNLGFDTQLDLFKMFVQLYGLTVHVDNQTKVVYAYTMQKVYDLKSQAKDWSQKLHDTKENENSFTIDGYAQNNVIKFDDNTTENVVDKAVFVIDNNTLEKQKELFAIKLEAGRNSAKTFGLIPKQIAHIPLEEIDSDGIITFSGGKPHIVDISTVRVSSAPITNAKIASHISINYFVNNFYDNLINKMLVNAKRTDSIFNLSEQDIEDYTKIKDGVPGAFVPVYIQKYGAYFYINKIKNFVSGKLTKCELVKL